MKSREKLQELRQMTLDQLKEELDRLKRAFVFLLCRRVNGQMKKMSEIRELRRNIARVMTIYHEQLALK